VISDEHRRQLEGLDGVTEVRCDSATNTVVVVLGGSTHVSGPEPLVSAKDLLPLDQVAWTKLIEEDDPDLPSRRELREKRTEKSRRIKKRRQRSGRGHDPRAQVVARVRAGGRGRGRR
jgi:hypothetical protein